MDTSGLVPETRTVNGKPLGGDITLTAEDVGAAGKEHTHTDYLPKKAPQFTGRLSTKRGNICIAGDSFDKSTGNVIGSRLFSEDVNGITTGKNCFNAKDALAMVSGKALSGDNYVYSLYDVGEAFWRILESAALPYGEVAMYGTKSGSLELVAQLVNVSIVAFDKNAETVSIPKKWDAYVSELCAIILYDPNGEDAWISNYRGTFLCGEDSLCINDGNHPGFMIGCGNRLTGGRVIEIGYELLATGNQSTNVAYKFSSDAIIMGKFNTEFNGSAGSNVIIVGGGDKTARKNVFRVTKTGVYAAGSYSSTGADYAELFEWTDGNPDEEDRVGRFVTLEGAKIRVAAPGDDFILGIVSGSPSVVGEVYDDSWQGMHINDIFGRPVWEDVQFPEYTREVPDPENPENTIQETVPAHTERCRKLNPNYDPSQTYIPRTERPEWGCVGLMGKLVVIDDGTCQVNGWAAVGEGGGATASQERTRFRVMERLDRNGEHYVRVLAL